MKNDKEYFYKSEYFRQLESQNTFFNNGLININKRMDKLYYVFLGFTIMNISIIFLGVKLGFNIFNVKV